MLNVLDFNSFYSIIILYTYILITNNILYRLQCDDRVTASLDNKTGKEERKYILMK